MSNPNTSLTQFQLDKQIPYGALNACGVRLVFSPSAHVYSRNYGDMVLVRDLMFILLYWRRPCLFWEFLGLDN